MTLLQRTLTRSHMYECNNMPKRKKSLDVYCTMGQGKIKTITIKNKIKKMYEIPDCDCKTLIVEF